MFSYRFLLSMFLVVGFSFPADAVQIAVGRTAFVSVDDVAANVPVIKESLTTTTLAPLCPNCGQRHAANVVQQAAPSGNGGSALAAANAQRARRGLRPFQWDPNLQRNVNRSVQIQSNRGRMGHMGQGMAGASGEGVGMSGSAQGFTTCFLYGSHQRAAAASQQGRNGRWFHALQVSGPGSDGGGGRRRRLFR